MVVEGDREMGFINSKIFIITALLGVCFYTVSKAEDVTASMRNFVKPQYNEKTHLLEYVITGTDAKTEGGVIEIINARIEIIGADGKTVRAVLTSPIAFYNQTTQFITGDQSIKFESLSFDADGIGFDASQAAQTLHIRKNVKLVVKSTEDIKSQFAIGKEFSEDTGKVSDTDIEPDTKGVSK